LHEGDANSRVGELIETFPVPCEWLNYNLKAHLQFVSEKGPLNIHQSCLYEIMYMLRKRVSDTEALPIELS